MDSVDDLIKHITIDIKDFENKNGSLRGVYFENCILENYEATNFEGCTLYKCYPQVLRGAIEIESLKDPYEVTWHSNNFPKSLSFSTTIQNQTFHNFKFEKLTLEDVTFENCDFYGTRFTSVDFENCSFESCNMTSVVHFENCHFKDFTFNSCVFFEVSFENCRFEAENDDACFESCSFTYVGFLSNMFNEASFTNGYFVETSFGPNKVVNLDIDGVFINSDLSKLKSEVQTFVGGLHIQGEYNKGTQLPKGFYSRPSLRLTDEYDEEDEDYDDSDD